MDLEFFIKGIVVGFLIAAPVGPVGILCAQRTLEEGLPPGLASGLGAAAADTLFGAAAAFGLTFISMMLLEYEVVLRVMGGVLLFLIGGRALIVSRPARAPESSAQSLPGDFLSTFFLTLTSPITILAFGPVFVALEAVVPKGDLAGAWSLIGGVLAGSGLWWLMLCFGVSLFRHKASEFSLRWVNRLAGGVILFFGVVVLLSLTELGRRVAG